mmetsp:Transcript_27733/g.57599  ORF Transcript_27733/g.57599 Transcript_27733/m.57599 type:complete len:406 (+) Transcript_27733:89-1306(+)
MVLEGAKKRAALLVLTAVVCDYIGVSMMRVTLPFFAKALGGTATLTGGIESMYGIGQVTGALLLPKLSDTWGRKAILTMSCLGSVVGYSLSITARYLDSPALLLASRIPVGLAKQTVTVSRAVVGDVTDPGKERSEWMQYLSTALAIGCVAGPFFGGQAAEYLGDLAPAFISVAIFTILTPVVFFMLPETTQGKKTDAAEEKSSQGDRSMWFHVPALCVLSVLCLPELGLIMHSSVTLYSYTINSLGKGKAWNGNLTAGSAVFQATFAYLMGICSKHGWSDISMMQIAVISFAIASGGIAWGQTVPAVICTAPFAAFANSGLRGYPGTLLSKQAPESRQGEAMGMLDLASSGLRVLAPLLAGMVMDKYGNTAGFILQFTLFMIALVLLPFLPAPQTPTDAKKKVK